MAPDAIYVDNALFLGRVEEQKQFRAALSEVLAGPAGEDLPYLLHLYGDGGIGKTTLAKRFRDIAQNEPPYKGAFQILWVDWEDERGREPGLQVGREHIRPETVFKLMHADIVKLNWGKPFGAYQDAVKKRGEAEKKAIEALSPGGDRDELAALRGAGAGALAALVRTSLPIIGEPGEKLTQAFLDAGIKVGAEQAAQLRAAMETRLRTRLDTHQYDLFLNPNEQLARALAEGLKKLAAGKPLVIFLDTYEIVDRTDLWLRIVMRAAGPRVMWVIGGRDNLVRSGQYGARYFKGYAEDFPRRLVPLDMRQLAEQDVRAMFADRAPGRPLPAADVPAISRATRGVPLALKEAAEMWVKGVALADIVGDPDEAAPGSQIVQRMTARYLLHAVSPADQQAVFALALARGDLDVLQAMLRPDNDQPFDLDGLLQRLVRDYASVHYEQARLHDEPAFFLRAYLREEIHRRSDTVLAMNRAAVESLRARLAGREDELPRLEDRCKDDDWTKFALDLAEYLLWVDETEAWHWLVPRLVESLAYSRELRRGLIQIANGWSDSLSQTGKKRFKALRATENAQATPEERAELLDELTRLERLGWLKESSKQKAESGRPDLAKQDRAEGDGARASAEGSERGAILDWQRGLLLYALEKYSEALAQYERTERALPEQGEALRKQLGEALNNLAGKLLWPNEAGSAVYSAEAERILAKVTDWLPDTQSAWYQWGTVLYLANNLEAALPAYQRASELDPKDANPLNGLGNVLGGLNRNEAAIAAYQQAMVLDPKYAYPHIGLGETYRVMSRHAEALAEYQRALELDAQSGLVHNGLGNLYVDQGQNEQALAEYQEAIRLDPLTAFPHNGLGNVYRGLGRNDEAAAEYRQASEMNSKYPDPHNGLANVYVDQGQWDKALEEYQKASELDPRNATAHNGRGEAYRRLGRYDDAIGAYQRSIALNEKLPAPHFNLAETYLRLGRLDDARRELNAYNRLDEMNVFEPLVTLGLIARHQGLAESDGLMERALANWDLAWQKRLDTAGYLLGQRAKALVCLGRKDEALAALEQAIAQMLPGDIIDFHEYELLQQAPAPPAGLEEMIGMLQAAEAKRK